MTGEQARQFFLPLILTLCFLPLLYGLALWVVHDGILGMVRFGLNGNDRLYRGARREIVGACGLSPYARSVVRREVQAAHLGRD